MKKWQLLLVAGMLFGLLLIFVGAVVLWGWLWAAAHRAGGSPPGMHEQIVPISHQSLQPYPELLAFDYDRIEFPPLPTTGEVRILIVDRASWQQANGYPPPNYDVSFQIYESGPKRFNYVSRFVALQGSPGAYQVVSNQMTFQGPLKYKGDPDAGLVPEFISITHQTQQVVVTGASVQGTEISYRGTDPRLKNAAQPLTPAEIGPILREWGYDFKVDLPKSATTGSGP